MKVKIGDKEFEVSDEAGKAINGFMAKAKKDAETAAESKKVSVDEAMTLRSARDSNEAKADSLKVENESLKVKIEESRSKNDSINIHELVKERKSIEEKAVKVCGEIEKMDAMDNMTIKKEVISKALPDVKVDEKSDDYINASFDTITGMEIKADTLADAINDKNDEDDKEKSDSLSPEQELLNKTESAYKAKL